MTYSKKMLFILACTLCIQCASASNYFVRESFYMSAAAGMNALDKKQKNLYDIGSRFSVAVNLGMHFTPNWSFEMGGFVLPDATVKTSSEKLKEVSLYYVGFVANAVMRPFTAYVKLAPAIGYVQGHTGTERKTHNKTNLLVGAGIAWFVTPAASIDLDAYQFMRTVDRFPSKRVFTLGGTIYFN